MDKPIILRRDLAKLHTGILDKPQTLIRTDLVVRAMLVLVVEVGRHLRGVPEHGARGGVAGQACSMRHIWVHCWHSRANSHVTSTAHMVFTINMQAGVASHMMLYSIGTPQSSDVIPHVASK